MFRFIKNIFVFFAIIYLPLRILAEFDFIDNQFSENTNIQSLQNKAKSDSLDVLFVGNSYCYSGIIPEIFDSAGLSVYNLGIATSGPYFYELITNDYLYTAKKKPTKIFFMVSPMTFSSKADNFVAYPIHRYLVNKKSNEGVVVKYGIINLYFDLLKKSVKKGLSNLFSEKRGLVSSEVSMSRGFVATEGIYKKENLREISGNINSYKNERFDTVYFNKMTNLAYQLEKLNIQVSFFEVPTNQLFKCFNTAYLDVYGRSISKLERDFPLYRNNQKLSFDCFRNFDHLNTKGATKTSKKILSKILMESVE